MALFTCDCGFAYQRAGPDKHDSDIFRYDRVKNYGNYWETELSSYWSDLSLSLSEIARRFGTTTLLIARHAIRLKLPMNTEGTRKLEGYTRHQNPIVYLTERIQECRNQWLQVITKFPDCSRQELMKRANTLYLWLQRNDSEWFNSHIPKQLKVNRKIDQLDWTKIDNDLISEVQRVCDEIRQESEELIRVSVTEIINRVGYKKWIDKRYQKLPRVTQLINEQMESLEDFMIRKLKLAEQYYIKRKRVPKRRQLIRRAVIENTTTLNSIKVQKEVDNTITRIEEIVIGKKTGRE